LIPSPSKNNSPFACSNPPTWLSQLVVLITFGVYISTINPALFQNDSPETITACFDLGISHPPSYPLHTLLGHLFSFFQIGNPAMTLNFFSAFLGACGVCLFATITWLLLSRMALSHNPKSTRFSLICVCLIGSFCFAFSKTYWSASLAAKGSIYILQVMIELCFFISLQHLLQKIQATNRSLIGTQFYFSIFIFGLGFANHWPTQMLLIPAIAALTLATLYPNKSKLLKALRLKHILTHFSFLFMVLSLYLYLPLRSHLYPSLNFGAPYTFRRFINSVSRLGYTRVETLASFVPTVFSTIQQKASYISDHFLTEFNFLFVILFFVGILILLRQGFKLQLLFLLFALLTAFLANLLYLQVNRIEFWHLDDHLLTMNWVTALLASSGAYFLLTTIHENVRKHSFSQIQFVIGLIVLSLLPFFIFLKHLPLNDNKREFLYTGYGMASLKSMDKNAIYFAEFDYDFFSLLYLTQVEHKRPDVRLILTPMLDRTYESELIAKQYPGLDDLIPFSSFLLRHPSNHPPIYCAFPNGPFSTFCLKQGLKFYFQPSGLLTNVFPYNSSFSKEKSIKSLNDFWEQYLITDKRSLNPINGLFLELCAHPYINEANYLKIVGNLDFWDIFYDHALGLIQENPWLAQTWSGRAEGDLLVGNKKEALTAFKTSAFEYLSVGMRKETILALQKAQNIDPTDLYLQNAIVQTESSPK
jgi:hypothetical protein